MGLIKLMKGQEDRHADFITSPGIMTIGMMSTLHKRRRFSAEKPRGDNLRGWNELLNTMFGKSMNAYNDTERQEYRAVSNEDDIIKQFLQYWTKEEYEIRSRLDKRS
ncbi:MAG: hypothetical protein ACREBW_03570 [Candidatus Micrarchaeaceae archaeon]